MPSEQFTNLVQMFKMQRAAAATDAPLDVLQLRQGFEMLGQMMPSVDGVTVFDIEVAGMPASKIVPDPAPDDRVILYLHGGGYCIGSRTSHAPLVANLAKAAGVTAILPEYRLGPEHVYPAAVDDALAAYDWVVAQGYTPSKIAVAGESAGGGLTGALLVRLRDEGRPLPSSAALISPWCDLTCDLTEPGACTDAQLDTDFLRPEQITAFADWYAPDAARRGDPTCSPGTADLSGLPPLLIQVGGQEILCGQGERMAAKAKDDGVDVALDIDPDMFHAWPLFAGALPEADEAIARIAGFMNARFS